MVAAFETRARNSGRPEFTDRQSVERGFVLAPAWRNLRRIVFRAVVVGRGDAGACAGRVELGPVSLFVARTRRAVCAARHPAALALLFIQQRLVCLRVVFGTAYVN